MSKKLYKDKTIICPYCNIKYNSFIKNLYRYHTSKKCLDTVNMNDFDKLEDMIMNLENAIDDIKIEFSNLKENINIKRLKRN